MPKLFCEYIINSNKVINLNFTINILFQRADAAEAVLKTMWVLFHIVPVSSSYFYKCKLRKYHNFSGKLCSVDTANQIYYSLVLHFFFVRRRFFKNVVLILDALMVASD